jgi:hypothetical protein
MIYSSINIPQCTLLLTDLATTCRAYACVYAAVVYVRTLQQVVRGQLDATGAYCTEPDEYKIIIGQGDPVVTSRFKDPTVPSNSAWRPSSVPAVRAQPWQNNYKDGTCGLRNVTDK